MLEEAVGMHAQQWGVSKKSQKEDWPSGGRWSHMEKEREGEKGKSKRRDQIIFCLTCSASVISILVETCLEEKTLM